MYCYCLFCESGKSRYVAEFARSLFSCETILPKQTHHMRFRGQMKDVLRDLLPGYLFLFAESPLPGQSLTSMQDVIRCLRTTDLKYELLGQDEAFALLLYQKGGTLGKTRVYQEGDRVRIRDGAFEGVQAEITKLDRRNHRMKIEIPFAGRNVTTWLEYEMTEPDQT